MAAYDGIVRDLILWLWKCHETASRQLSGRAVEIHRRVSTVYTQFGERELERLLSESSPLVVDFLRERKFLFLEPIMKNGPIVPVLSMRFDFRKSIPDIQVKVALFLLDTDEATAAIGYRFETPGFVGQHRYYHAQLIREFDRSNVRWKLPSCPVWLPDTQPAFVLDANHPVKLLICLLISLYGLDYVSKQMEGARFWDAIKKHVNDMRWSSITYNYFRVKFPNMSKCYRTFFSQQEFKAQIAKTHKNCSVALSDRAQYLRSSPTEQDSL